MLGFGGIFLMLLIIIFEIWVVKQLIAPNQNFQKNGEIKNILICGCQPNSQAFADRMLTSKLIIKENSNLQVIISGTDQEVMAMQNDLKNLSINQVIIDDKATNTFENIKNNQHLINHNTVVISNNFHLFRIKFIAKFLNLKPQVYAKDQKFYFQATFREFFACQKNFGKLIILFLNL